MANKKTLSDLIGKTIPMINDSQGTGFAIGTRVTITGTAGSWAENKGDTLVEVKYPGAPGRFTLKISDLDLQISLEDLERKAAFFRKSLQEIQEKMDYLQKNDLDEFDEVEYQIARMINTWESDLDRHQKSQKIRELMDTVRV